MKGSPLELRKAKEIASQFLAGLEAIHQAGLVHCDFKPENVMITRTDRVVVMDLGIAKQREQAGSTISGTLPYMSPEQLAGKKVDARSDLFSAGVVLAEMIQPEGIGNEKKREKIWEAVRYDPMRLPESPWKGVISRAVSANADNRYPSAAALSRALDEVTQRSETIEERTPYPGLASFTITDSEYFFGRELEVETFIKKLNQLHMIGLIGPSGAGKTSFLRAGLIPALPQGWHYVFTQPGDMPIVSLAQSLAPIVSMDAEAVARMVQFEEPDVAIWILNRLRERYSKFLLIVDRFEELFTLNSPESRSRFAEIIGRAPVEASIRIVLSMRDDFLIFCKEHQALSPIFSELTAMLPLSGQPLRRALVQPTLKCGYRFEDETLVDEIISDVENERGALPLMAFAASRLWEKRDRQAGVLTRNAYQEIGGVAGALAQHAERTMERIGTQREPIVREIFRNLITAQNTRAARDTEELLSVFAEKNAAEEVLRILIDARLLTSFETQQADGEKSKRRVEIIHESLLSNWPRLVRWQTQDAGSAQLRDQLRQAAQMWEQRKHSEDLIWTGAAYLEFEAWRQRYSGGLTTTEEAFARAMKARATKRRRQRNLAFGVIFASMVIVAMTLALFWRRSEASLGKAEMEARRSEASKLLALGQSQAESYPTAALAYATKSIELTDTMEARLFALKIIQQAPPEMEMPVLQQDGLEAEDVDFSSDAKWIAIAGKRRAQIRSADGKVTLLLKEYPSWGLSEGVSVRFGLNNNPLFSIAHGEIRIASLPNGNEVARWKLADGDSYIGRTKNGPYLFVKEQQDFNVYFTPDEKMRPEKLGQIPSEYFSLSDNKLLFADVDRKNIYLRSIKDWSTPPRIVCEYEDELTDLALHPSEKQFAWISRSGQIHIRSIDQPLGPPLRILSSAKGIGRLQYDPSGTRLAAFGTMADRPTTFVWDLTAPPGTLPIVLTKANIGKGGHSQATNGLAFHPFGKWLATANVTNVGFWHLPSVSKTLEGHEGIFIRFGFTPDGHYLLSKSTDGTIRSWPLTGRIEDETRVILRDKFGLADLVIDPETERLAVGTRDGRVLLANLDGTAVRTFQGYSANATIWKIAFGEHGRLLAASVWMGPKQDKFVRIWHLDSGDVDVLGPVAGAGEGNDGGVHGIQFLDENHLVVSGYGGLEIFDIKNNRSKLLSNNPQFSIAITPDKRFLFAGEWQDPQKKAKSELVRIDLKKNLRTVVKYFGGTAIVDPTGQMLASINANGVQVGRLTGQEPHLVFSRKGWIDSIAFSPDSRWIAVAGRDMKISLVQVPDLSKPAPHTLPHDQFLAKLKSFTNLHVVQDSSSSTGWKLEVGPFPGWEKIPSN
jgi:WD40 repeat protein